MAERDLVFVGGGHTHALVIKKLGMRPIPGVRVTLISDLTMTPYSGMLPGFVAGHYSYEQTHIDLNRLCRWAGVTWIHGRVNGIDANGRCIHIENQASVSYDTVSIDIGSTPDVSVPGAFEFATGVKPVSQFNSIWAGLLDSAARVRQPVNWAVIGAGAGGVELVLAMAHRLRDHQALKFHLVFPGEDILPDYPPAVRDKARRALTAHGVSLHRDFRVAKISSTTLTGTKDQALAVDRSIWCTGAAAASWLKGSGLDLNDKGFINVNSSLQSSSHASVFACGDIAHMSHDPRPKAGVYAVRQAPYLYDNLHRAFAGKALKSVSLQREFLSLLSLGKRRAVGCRNGIVASGKWVWWLKNHIDCKFMQRLNDPGPLPEMTPAATELMHCAGCGSKLGPTLIAESLERLNPYADASVTPALGRAEDAALMRVNTDMLVAQSIDGFRSFTDDLDRFGRICVNHALSDLYAMGARPVAAQVWINLAFNHPRVQQRDHHRLMSGITTALTEQQTVLAGGHSTQGMETHVAIVANGEVAANSSWQKSTPVAGHQLVLTKPLGTGIVLAADMQAQASSDAVESAMQSMLQSNRAAADLLERFSPSAVTDVTGFGLLGHLLEMLRTGDCGARLNLSAVPLLDGVDRLIARGIRSTLYPQLQHYLQAVKLHPDDSDPSLDILLDPQTSGGLLIALAEDAAVEFIDQLPTATVIGEVTAGGVIAVDSRDAVHTPQVEVVCH